MVQVIEAGIHQQQMERNCSEGVPREWEIWRLHWELGCLVSFRPMSWLSQGFMLSWYILSVVHQNLEITWWFCGGWSLSWNCSCFFFGCGHGDHFEWPDGTSARQEGIAALHSLLCAAGSCFYTNSWIHNLEQIQNFCIQNILVWNILNILLHKVNFG